MPDNPDPPVARLAGRFPLAGTAPHVARAVISHQWLGRLRRQRTHGFVDGGVHGVVRWRRVLEVLVINRLCDACSEFAVQGRWFVARVMDELLWLDIAEACQAR
jgi:hypothetical protein